jgi:hypothetical protein
MKNPVFGPEAKPFHQQFPDLHKGDAARLDEASKAIHVLLLTDVLTREEADRARNRIGLMIRQKLRKIAREEKPIGSPY